MKERPILFNGAMVRALLDGSKTQTRRIVKQKPVMYMPGQCIGLSDMVSDELRCPYGQPGDRLWVRESYRLRRESLNGAPMDGVAPSMFCDSTRAFDADGEAPDWAGKLRPSIHMPRWASRILLEITGVRVERLQEISEADAIAEGIGLNASAAGVPMTTPSGETMPRAMYRDLWESINGAGSWDANPWVWVVELKRVAP